MAATLPKINPGPHRADTAIHAGTAIPDARGALILVHGRGASPESILGIASELRVDRMHLVAPRAHGRAWYPQSFLQPMDVNEPGISSALATIHRIVGDLTDNGIPRERIAVLGFSQGACLASEFLARAPGRYAGLFALSGGLIGPPGTERDYPGSLSGTPAFFGCSDIDMHIPEERVTESAQTFERMGAEVTCRLYPGMGHTVNEDEIAFVNAILGTVGSDR